MKMKYLINRMAPTHGERGSILPLVAIVIVTLAAFMGLALDASYLFLQKRRAQSAADAGAIGAAQELLRGNTTNVTTAARMDTSLNNFTHGVNGVSVTVSNPPVSGPRVGNSKFAEVVVAAEVPTWFARFFGSQSSTVRARAVAGLSDSDGCVYAVNRDTSQQNNRFFVNGTTNSSFECGVFSNANFRAVGGGCVVTPTALYSGSYSNSNASDPNCGPVEAGHGVPIVDPLSGRFTLPSTTPCGFNNYKETSGSALTLTPGVYCGGIDIGGSIPTATFSAGTYVLVGGGLKLGSGVNVTGTGVTFFNTYPGTQSNKYEAITINTSGTVSLSAPTTGTNKALLFYQDPRISWVSSNGSTITASSTSVFDGIFYFPTTDLTYAGNSSTNGYTILLAYNVKISGNAQVRSNYSQLGGNPIHMASFIE
jgi:hypothetical protein